MKKILLICSVLCILSISLYSQSSIYSQYNNPQSIYITSGSHFTKYGILNNYFGNIGYEYQVIKYLSLFYNISVWKALDIFISSSFGIKLHIDSTEYFDPYLGLSYEQMTLISSSNKIIDLPALLGLNINLNQNFGLKIEYKLYLLSLNYMFSELNAGLRFSF